MHARQCAKCTLSLSWRFCRNGGASKEWAQCQKFVLLCSISYKTLNDNELSLRTNIFRRVSKTEKLVYVITLHIFTAFTWRNKTSLEMILGWKQIKVCIVKPFFLPKGTILFALFISHPSAGQFVSNSKQFYIVLDLTGYSKKYCT